MQPPVAYPTDIVRELFPAHMRRDGALFSLGSSQIIGPHVVAGGVAATFSPVMGFEVHALWYGPDRPGWCTCEVCEREGVCAHMWALFRWADISLDHRNARPAEPEAAQRSAWRARAQRLARLAPPRTIEAAWGDAESVDFELRYVLHLPPRPRDDGEIQLVVEQRKRRKDGAFGEGRTFSASRSESPELPDPLDRRLVALLSSSEQRSVNAYGVQRFSTYHGPGWHDLRDELAREVLPLIAEAGRLDLQRQRKDRIPVPLDRGAPWQFRFVVRPTEDGSEVALAGELTRGNEALPLDKVVQFVGRAFVVTPLGLGRFDVPEGAPWMFELWASGPLLAPRPEARELAAVVADVPVELDVSALGPEFALALPKRTAPRPHLMVAPAPPGKARSAARVTCEVAFDYGTGDRVPPESASRSLRCSDGSTVLRDFTAERARLAEYIACGARRTRSDARDGSHGTVAAKDIPGLVHALLDRGWSVTAEGRRVVAATSTSVSVSTGLDWFEVEGGVHFGDQHLSFPQLLRALRADSREVALGDGSTGLLPERWLEQWGLLEFAEGQYGDRLTFGHSQAWLLDALLAERAEATTDPGFDAARAKLAAFRGIQPALEPPGFQGVLRPYQRDALGWFDFLRDLGFGGCLADDMGLGKTVQVLALLMRRRTAERVGPSLVVAPKSLVFNWLQEARRFAPELRVQDYTGSERAEVLARRDEFDVLVTTYGTLRLDAAELADVPFDYVVLDEATAIKNHDSQSAKAARLLRADHRLALSGTPVENHIGELWSLFEFLNPGMLGRSTRFKELAARGGSAGGRRDLSRALRPFFLRRTKAEVLRELPQKSEQVLTCELSPSERKQYDDLKAHYQRALLEGTSGETFMALEALLRLRQAACHPGLLDPARAAEDSAKLDTLLPRLTELAGEGHKALVFSQFTSLLGLVRTRLDALGVRYEYLDGQTRDRAGAVQRFQEDPDVSVFLISLKAGGHGLNLTAAEYVFLLDPWWNPAVEAQAVDRAHRMGQTKPVFAYRLIARGTVEERVHELQEKKRELAAALFGEDAAALGKVTRAELLELLA